MIKIGHIRVSLELREVFLGEEMLRIGTRAFDILEMLITAKGGLVMKDDILRRVWPNTIVEENNLQVHISSLRKLLGESRDLIKTTPGRGYRLVLPRDELRPVQSITSTVGTSNVSAAIDTEMEAKVRAIPVGLPIFHGPLIGREVAVKEVLFSQQTSPFVTLVGPGGIGKTQLAIHVARLHCLHSRGEVCFVALGSNESPRQVLSALASALRIEMLDNEMTLRDVADAMADREILLMLDNCEHVVNEAAAICEYLVHANNRVRILATSREPLRASGEQLYWVAPLDLPAEGDDFDEVARRTAVQMFLARVRAFDPNFAYNVENFRQIAVICRRLDGVPLALELAAARAATLGISELDDELEDRFRILTSCVRGAPLRHRTLKAAFDWSYRFLSDAERIVLRRVSVLESHFPLELACQVAARGDLSEADVTEAIVGLASKSLLMFCSEGPRKMYRLLESTRQYAMQELDDSERHTKVSATQEEYWDSWMLTDRANAAMRCAQ
jgi:predicted ATPase/DNA-binding winged helix-turn-helix (wHTH) protein